jgi:hypothetical protein
MLVKTTLSRKPQVYDKTLERGALALVVRDSKPKGNWNLVPIERKIRYISEFSFYLNR